MKIYLNKQELNKNIESLSLPDLLVEIKDELENHILKDIFVNEVEVNEKYLKESLLDKEDIDKIKFTTQQTGNLIEETLKDADEYLPKLKKGILTTANNFRNDEIEKGNSKYQNILEGIEWYTEVIDKILSILDDEDLYDKYKKLVIELNKQLNQLMAAYKKDDMVLVADILEYEIEEYIEEFIELNKETQKYNEIN